jgi:nucleoside-diphosphate-sugar epimerase
MRVVVTGASGNVGTSLLRALAGDGAVTSVLGLARRPPGIEVDKTTWASADVTSDDLAGHLREAASEIRRFFLGPLAPGSLARAGTIPVVPKVKRLRTQAVHADDVGQAYRLAVVGDARGPFNLAADPVLDADAVADLLDARQVRVPAGLLKAGAAATWRLHLQPVSPGWLDLALQSPLLDTGRAQSELGWRPRHSATAALQELLAGLREAAGAPTPPLDPDAGGPLRLREFRTGVGGESD